MVPILLGGVVLLLLWRLDGGSVLWLALLEWFLVSAFIVSRYVAEPLYDIVMVWSPESPPVDWLYYRQRWWYINLARTVGATMACVSFLVASYRLATC